MKKLINGIVAFHKNVRSEYRDTFARLALEQAPDALFIACSDSRVVPNLFASTDPGDLFVVRNVGGLIPPCNDANHSVGDESEWAAIEFALHRLEVRDIIVCGHSDCGAMKALWGGRNEVKPPHLRSWLRYGDASLKKLETTDAQIDKRLAPYNQMSQVNVLQQLDHLRSYSIVEERIRAGKLRLHAWWFDIKNADVLAYDEAQKRFVVIDEESAKPILVKLGPESA